LKRALLLGAGPAHLAALKAFAAQPVASAQLAWLAPGRELCHAPMLPGWVAGAYTAAACRIPLTPLATHAHAAWHEGRVVGLDAAARRVRLADGSELGYDVLSIDLAAAPDRDAIPGAREHALFLRPLEAFMPLWERLRALADERALCVVVVGSGVAAVELALAVAQRLGERARVSLVTGGAPPLPAHPPGLQQRIRRALKRQRITLLEDSVAAIDAQQLQLGRGVRVACDAPLIALDPAAPGWLRESGLALDEAGRVVTLATLQSRSFPEVFATGELAAGAGDGARIGAALAFNLRRLIGGGALEAVRQRRAAPELIACPGHGAILRWGGWSMEANWVGRWKDRIDRRFVEGHGGLG